jgi:hypothetical protein
MYTTLRTPVQSVPFYVQKNASGEERDATQKETALLWARQSLSQDVITGKQTALYAPYLLVNITCLTIRIF